VRATRNYVPELQNFMYSISSPKYADSYPPWKNSSLSLRELSVPPSSENIAARRRHRRRRRRRFLVQIAPTFFPVRNSPGENSTEYFPRLGARSSLRPPFLANTAAMKKFRTGCPHLFIFRAPNTESMEKYRQSVKLLSAPRKKRDLCY